MEVDNGRNIRTKASTTGPIVDWFADVVRSDLDGAADVADADNRSRQGPGGSRGRMQRVAHRLVGRYQRMPSWVLLVQIFLAFAWGRSGLAHALRGDWWNGQQVNQFLASETGLRVDAYQYVLTGIVEPMPSVTATIVVVMELLIAAMLLLNHRVPLALGLAIFLNLQLILAGQVSPSVFYLVAALGIAIWRLETTGGPETLRRLSGVAVLLGIVLVAFLIPAVRTLRPEGALEDPALVLAFLIALTAIALWWLNRRVTLANETLAELTNDRPILAPRSSQPVKVLPSSGWLVASLTAAAAILIGGFSVGDDQPPAGEESEATSGAAQARGSFDSPYPFGLSVTLNYNDLQFERNQEWQVQVLETVLDDSNPIRSSPTIDGRLAMARVRLTYHQGGEFGPVDDIRFNAVGRTGAVYPPKIEGCGQPEGRLQGAQLGAGQATEGWICWPVPDDEVASLVMAVEAEPADGVLYMSLQEAIDG